MKLAHSCIDIYVAALTALTRGDVIEIENLVDASRKERKWYKQLFADPTNTQQKKKVTSFLFSLYFILYSPTLMHIIHLQPMGQSLIYAKIFAIDGVSRFIRNPILSQCNGLLINIILGL
jgi:hypothetical protein